MQQPIEKFYVIAHKQYLKFPPGKIFFMLPSVENIGHENGFKKIKAIQCKFAVFHKTPSRNTKNELIKFIGSWNFCSNFVVLLNNFKLI